MTDSREHAELKLTQKHACTHADTHTYRHRLHLTYLQTRGCRYQSAALSVGNSSFSHVLRGNRWKRISFSLHLPCVCACARVCVCVCVCLFCLVNVLKCKLVLLNNVCKAEWKLRLCWQTVDMPLLTNPHSDSTFCPSVGPSSSLPPLTSLCHSTTSIHITLIFSINTRNTLAALQHCINW